MLSPKHSFAKLNLFPISIILFSILFLQQSCKKTDSILPATDKELLDAKGKEVNITAQFFKLPANASSAIQRAAGEFQKQNSNKEFINSFVKKEGFAIWDKAMISISKRKINHNQLSASVESEGIRQ